MKIDLAIILLYLFVTLLIAIVYQRREKGPRSYFVVQKKYSLLTLTATFFATVVGAASTFYVAEEYYKAGTKFFFVLSGTYITSILIALFVVPKMSKWLGKLTPGEIIADIYSSKLRRVCGLTAAIVSIGFVAVQIHAFGYVIAFFYNIPKHYSIILGGMFTIFYTSYGGINSVIRTDVFQFCMIVVTVIIMSTISFNELSDGNSLYNELNLLKTGLDFNKRDLILWLNFSLLCFNPSIIQRILIGRNIRQSQHARLLSLALWIMFSTLIGFCGIAAYLMFPEINPEMTIPTLIHKVIPAGLKGIVVTGFLASIMSTADSELNIAGVSIYKDIFQYEIHKKGLFTMRKISFALGTLAILISLSFNSMVEILFFVMNFWSITFMFPLIFGIIGLKISYKSVMYSISFAIIISIIWESFLRGDSLVSSALVGGFANILAFFMFYLLQKANNKKII
jgi:solute:Na+ symporter, SSS family